MIKFFRAPVYLYCLIITLTVSSLYIPVYPIGSAHASSVNVSPTISLSVRVARPGQIITVTATGFAPGEFIEVYWNITRDRNLGFFQCTDSANCAGKITLPQDAGPGLTEGIHQLVAVGASNNLVAEASITIKPIIHSLPSIGGPATSIALEGWSFEASETLQVYWNTSRDTSAAPLLLGSVTTFDTGWFSFQFDIPSAAKVHKNTLYTISVARAGHRSPGTLTTDFHYVPARLTATASIHSGEQMHVHLTNFQSGEDVTITWKANTGQLLTTVHMDFYGNGDATFTPPPAQRGFHILTATGASSGIQARSRVDIRPGILLSPNRANPGDTIHIIGGGYTPRETVSIYFQNRSNGVLPASADASGTFTASLTVPTIYKGKNLAYFVHADGTTGKEFTSTRFYMIIATLTTPSQVIVYGSAITLNGQFFAPNEQVSILWNYGQSSQLQVASITADSNGSFSISLNTPSDPNLGDVTIAAIGSTSALQAFASVHENAGLVVSPTSGPFGTLVHVSGGGFSSSEQVIIFYFGNAVGSAITDASGSFTLTFAAVPFDAPPSFTGAVIINVSGNNSGVSATANFTITLT